MSWVWMSCDSYRWNLLSRALNAYRAWLPPIHGAGLPAASQWISTRKRWPAITCSPGRSSVRSVTTMWSSRSAAWWPGPRSEEHTSELQSRGHLVCRLLLEKKKTYEEVTRLTRDI